MDVYLMYLRKSRADEEKEALGQHETLSLHRERLNRLCKERGYVVEEVFEELVSGESVSARTEFQRLMSAVQTRRYAGVVVHALDRLGRGDMMEYGWILSTFQYTGTLIVTPERIYDPSVRADLQILQLQMFFANDELAGIKKRLREGKEEHSARGEHIASRAPLGYRKVETPDGRKTLEPDEWADTVKRVFQAVADGEKLWTISCRLFEQGVPGSWHNQRVKTMVTNPVYKGKIAWNRTKTVIESRDGMEYRKKCVRQKEYQEVDGLHPAIVDDDLWEAANAMIGKNPRGPKGPLLNPLAGLLKCGKCGRTMYLASSTGARRNYNYYRHPLITECQVQGARMEAVVGALKDIIEQTASHDGATDVLDARGEEKREEADALERAVSASERKVKKLMDLYMGDAINVSEYRELRETEEAAQERARARLDEIRAACGSDPEAVSVSSRNALALFDSADAETVNTFLKSFIERVDYSFDGEMHLEVFFR